LVQEVVERGALAGAGGAEQKQVGIHLPVQPVQGVKGNRAATAIEHRDTGVPCPLAASPDRREIGGVLGEHQLGVPLAFVLRRMVDAGQPAQIAIQRCHFIGFPDRLQTGVEHDVGQLQAALIEFDFIAPAQVKRQRAAIEFVRTAYQRPRLLYVFERLFGCQRLADGLLGKMQQVLRHFVFFLRY